jgi:hypothetical protein
MTMWVAAILGVAVAVGATVGPTVGMEGRTEVTLPGSPLEAKPVQDKAPLILRVASTQPTDGGAVRYDLRYIGLVPGKHDLKRYLVRADGSPTDDLPAMPVEVAHLLPELHKGELVAQEIQPLGFIGGYRGLMTAAIVVWLLLLAPLIFLRRKRKNEAVAPPAPAQPTLADRLRPLVEQAAEGTLSPDGKGQLERMLLGYWRQRLNLRQSDMAESMVLLRRHHEAGLLLHALEEWLHRPPGAASIDVAAVLAPYRNVPGDAVATSDAAGRRVA